MWKHFRNIVSLLAFSAPSSTKTSTTLAHTHGTFVVHPTDK